MKKLVFRFSIILGVIASLLCFVPNHMAKSYAAEEYTQISYYLLDDSGASYESNIEAGSVSGYGSYAVGYQATLNATANDGFNFVGWEIDGNIHSSSFSETFDNTDDGIDNGATVDYTISTNGLSTTSSLTISKVPKDLIVRAVFDYNYFSFSLSEEIIDALALNEDKLTIGADEVSVFYPVDKTDGDTTIAYKTENSGIITYTNAIVNKNYYEELIFDGTSLYTSHEKQDGSSEIQKIDYSRGSFRANDEFNVNYDLKLTDKMEESKNYDVIAFSINGVAVSSDNVNINKDGYKRTTSFSVSGEITENSLLTWQADKLTVLDLVPYIQKTDLFNNVSTDLAEEEDRNLILSQVKGTNQFIKVHNGRYLIKHSSKNGGLAFKITCSETVFFRPEGSEKSYAYFTFKTMNGERNCEMGYIPTQDYEQVELIYTPTKFAVSFKFVLINNGKLDVRDDISVLESTQFRVRGDNYTIELENLASYPGYELFCFTTDISKEFSSYTRNQELTVTIDEERPEDITIYMVFSQINYIVRLNNVDELNLIKNNADLTQTTIYTMASVELWKNGESNKKYTTSTTVGSSIFTSKTFEFETYYKLNDILKININANKGFKIILSTSSVKDASAELTYSSMYEATLNKDFLTADPSYVKVETDATGNRYIIDLYLHAEHETYTFNYRINPATHGAQSIIMATINATKPNRQDVVLQTSEEGTTEPKSQVITITGVRLYDEITISATVKEITEGSGKFYNFQRFASSGGIGLTPVQVSNQTYSYVYTVEGNETITAIVSAPESQLQIVIDNPEAYDIEQIKVYFDKDEDGAVNIAENDLATLENGAYMVSGTIKVVLENFSNIEFGYYFEGYNVYASSEVSSSRNNNVIEFVINSSEAHVLQLSFPEIIYKVKATQTGGGVETSDIIFGTDELGQELNYTNLKMSNLNLEFQIPAGVYVSSVMAGSTNLTSSFAKAYDGTQSYVKTLTVDELKTLASTGKTSSTAGMIEIEMQFTYSAVTFNVTINLAQNADASKNKYENINDFVNITASYKNGNETVELQNITKDEQNVIIIKDIPYSATGLSLIASVLESSGLTHFGWTDLAGATINASNSSQLDFGSVILENKIVEYSVVYKAFTIILNYNDNQGAPLVNGNLDRTDISVLDRLEIHAQAKKDLGYKFVGMYQSYVYDENRWEQDKTNFEMYVVLSDGFAKLLPGAVYDATKTYYIKMQMDEQTSTMFLDEDLVLSEYCVSNDTINMMLLYEYIEVKLEHSASLTGQNSLDSYGITVDNYATYNIYNKETGAQISSAETVNYSTGYITIEVAMKDIQYSDLTVNLITGVDFKQAQISVNGTLKTWDYLYIDNEKNAYIFEIDISSLIPDIPDTAESLLIEYVFEVKTFTNSMTTNIPNGANFYTKMLNAFTPAFIMTGTSKDGIPVSNFKKSALTVKKQFLDVVEFTYSFPETDVVENEYQKYFKIDKYVIKIDGEIIPKDKYAEYGIKENSTTTLQITVPYITNNVQIILQVEPIIYLNGAENGKFNRDYKFDLENATGIAQTITIGTDSSCDVQMADFLYNSLVKEDGKVVFEYTNELGNPVHEIKNVGEYIITFSFKAEGEYSWLSSLNITNQVKVKINKLNLELKQSTITETIAKPYDGSSSISFESIKKFVNISGVDFEGNVKSINLSTNNLFGINCFNANIVNEAGENSSAARAMAYNVILENLTIQNSNFELLNKDSFKIIGCVRIDKKLLEIKNLNFYDKVYDGTRDLTVSNMNEVSIHGIVANGDDVRINFENLIIKFETAEIGLNKNIIIENYEDCLIGTAKGNYYLSSASFDITSAPSIYPYSITANIQGYGLIELVNLRGKTEQQYVSLIPIGAELEVVVIERGGSEYANMYQTIEEYLSGNREFEVGYKLSFNVAGKQEKISNLLYINIPTVDSLRNIISVTGEHVDNLKYDMKDGYALIDLSQISIDIDTFVLIANRSLFKIWQIILIVSIIAVIIGGIVITIVIIRKRKLKKYSINEKI